MADVVLHHRWEENKIVPGSTIGAVLARPKNRLLLLQADPGAGKNRAGSGSNIGAPSRKAAVGGPFAKQRLQGRVVIVELCRAADQDVVVILALQVVIANAADEDVASVTTGKLIVASAAKQDIVALVSDEPIITIATAEYVIAAASINAVVARAAGELIVTAPTVDRVVSSTCVYLDGNRQLIGDLNRVVATLS